MSIPYLSHLKTALKHAASILVLLLVCMAWLLFSHSGLIVLMRVAQMYGHFQVQSIEGRLINTPCLRHVNYRNIITAQSLMIYPGQWMKNWGKPTLIAQLTGVLIRGPVPLRIPQMAVYLSHGQIVIHPTPVQTPQGTYDLSGHLTLDEGSHWVFECHDSNTKKPIGSLVIDTQKPHSIRWSSHVKTPHIRWDTQGRVNQQWHADWFVSVTGSVTAQGSIQGDRNAPYGTAHIQFERPGTTSHIDFQMGPQQSRIRLTMDNLTVQGYALKNLIATAIGTLNQHRLDLQATLHEKPLHAQLLGHVQSGQWQGQVQTLTLPPWSLSKPAKIVASPHEVRIEHMTWKSPNNQLTTQAQWHDDGSWQGLLDFHPFDLDSISEFLPPSLGITQLKGRLEGRMRLQKQHRQWSAQGHVFLSQGQATLPGPNLSLAHLEAELYTHPKQPKIFLKAKAQSGQGILRIQGSAEPQGTHLDTHLTLQGQQVLLFNQPWLYLTASPDIHVHLFPTPRTIIVSGSLQIPQARMASYAFNGSTLTLPEETVVVDDPNNQPWHGPKHLRYLGQIHVQLGDDIQVVTKGLNAQLAGHLTLVFEDPNKLLATGNLKTLHGTYTAYGQVLTIDRGILNYINSPIDNPSLTIQASRKLDTNNASNLLTQQDAQTVGIRIQGTPNKLKTQLFSNPASHSQADILSLILFGQPSGELKKDNAALLIQAASALNFGSDKKGLGYIVNQLRHGLGLSELSVQSEMVKNEQEMDVQNAAVVMGKYLTPNLYIRYSHGIFEPTDTLGLRYKVNRYFTIQSQSSHEGNGIDLLYLLER